MLEFLNFEITITVKAIILIVIAIFITYWIISTYYKLFVGMQNVDAYNPFCRTYGFHNDHFRQGFYQALGKNGYSRDEFLDDKYISEEQANE